VSQEESQILHNINYYSSDIYMEKGSTFRAFATPVVNRQDARLAFKAISRFPGTAEATHLIAAYHDTSGEFEYYDDGDHGIGRFIFDIIYEAQVRGVMVFVARDYGGQHLGPLRFEIVQTVVDQAMSKLAAAIQRNPLIADPANLQMMPFSPSSADAQPQEYKPVQQQSDKQTSEDEQPQAAPPMQLPQAAQPMEQDNGAQEELSIDSTRHKISYPGTPIRQTNNSDIAFKTPPQPRSAGRTRQTIQ
jgi:hypothetical protein